MAARFGSSRAGRKRGGEGEVRAQGERGARALLIHAQGSAGGERVEQGRARERARSLQTTRRRWQWTFFRKPLGHFLFLLFFCFLFKNCSKNIIWGTNSIQKNIRFIWLESLLNVEANHKLSFGIWKCFESILDKGKVMPIKVIFGKTIIWST